MCGSAASKSGLFFEDKSLNSTVFRKNNECTKDSHCVGVQKCCSDGCRKVCVYAEKNTACLLLKGAYQQIGLMNYVKCRPGELFEVQNRPNG